MKIQINKSKKIKIFILGGICGILSIVSIFLTIECATSGVEVANLQKNESDLLVKQQDLQQQLVENLSTGNINQKSSELGYSKVRDMVYVGGSDYVEKTSVVAKLQ